MADLPKERSPDQPDFEQALKRLEEIVHLLEEGELGLNESLERYEEGVKLLRQSYDLLQRASGGSNSFQAPMPKAIPSLSPSTTRLPPISMKKNPNAANRANECHTVNAAFMVYAPSPPRDYRCCIQV